MGKKVFSYALDLVSDGERVEATAGHDGPAFYILNRLPDAAGRPVDLATGRQLAKWFLDQLKDRGGTEALHRLDGEYPGWRKQLREHFEGLEDPGERELLRDRWRRIEDILESLHLDAEEREKLLRSPALESKWREAVEGRRAGLEAEAEAKAKPRREVIEKEIESLDRRLAERREEIAAEEHRVERLLEHFESGRERLVQDFLAFDKLLGNRWSRSPAEPPLPDSPAISPWLVSRGSEHEGLCVETSDEFLWRVLVPGLRRWSPQLPEEAAKLFHCALLACRALLVPHPGWTRAYAEALGETARMAMIRIEPHWITFRDPWDAGLAEVWEAACSDPSRLHLVHLQDLNRALPECWLRPCLDLLRGFRDRLPLSPQPEWPGNLRLLASPAPDAAALPLSEFVARHFAAVPLRPTGDDESVPFHVVSPRARISFATWKSWQAEDLETTLVNHGDAAVNAENWARELRFNRPLEYVEATADVA